MHNSVRFIAVFTITAALTGCPGREVSKVEPTPIIETRVDIPVEINRDIDIVFVIDNSGSMAQEQASLAANFSRFIAVLENIEGGLPNVHIGVVSTDVGAGPFNISGCTGNGDNGILQSSPRSACDPPAGAFISDIDDGMGGRIKNYTGTLADTFSCIAQLGIDGCGFEQPLESMRRALNGSSPTNAGFLRKDAFLAVIVISDEDDCSASNTAMFDTAQNSVSDPLGPLSSFRCFEFGVACDPDDPRAPGIKQDCRPRPSCDNSSEPGCSEFMFDVADYVAFLKGLKQDPKLVIVAGIIGNPSPVTVGANEMNNPELDPSCVSGSGDAAPGVRLASFLEQFPLRNTITTICNDDLSDALVIIAQLLTTVFGNPCIAGNIDIDPDTPGVQYDCQVSDVRFLNEDRQEETVLPACETTSPAAPVPCWQFQEDTDCDTETNLSLVIERGSGSVPSGTTVVARCVVK